MRADIVADPKPVPGDIEDRQCARLSQWQSAADKTFESPAIADLYRQRAQRFVDIVQLRQPDRVPCLLMSSGIVSRFAGISFADTYYDQEKTAAATLKFMEDFRPEYTLFSSAAIGKAYDLLGYHAYKWPGSSLPDNVPFQYVEDEYMPAADYDALINNPEGYMLRTYLPRVCSNLQGLRMIPGLFSTVEMVGVGMWLGGLTTTPLMDALARIAQAIDHIAKRWAFSMQTTAKVVGRYGCPSLLGGVAKAPFDLIADTLRGTVGALTDMYRRPDKVLAAVEALVPVAIHAGVGTAQAGPPPFVFMPLHKGASAFMSFKHFQRFYWPTFKRQLEGIIAAGMVPFCFVEGSYDEARLELIAGSGLPAGRTVWLFDRSDMHIVKRTFSGFACFGGNVPNSLFLAGTVAQMEKYCKQLIDDMAPGGGFFISPGATIDEANPDIVRAFAACAEKYGVY